MVKSISFTFPCVSLWSFMQASQYIELLQTKQCYLVEQMNHWRHQEEIIHIYSPKTTQTIWRRRTEHDFQTWRRQHISLIIHLTQTTSSPRVSVLHISLQLSHYIFECQKTVTFTKDRSKECHMKLQQLMKNCMCHQLPLGWGIQGSTRLISNHNTEYIHF